MYQGAVVGALTDIDTSARNTVGARRIDADGKEYVYLKGVASTEVGFVVTYDEAGQTALIDTDTAATCKGPVAVAMAAVLANQFGWYQVFGSASVQAISGGGAADNAIVYATATAGEVDDVAIANCQIVGAVFRSAESAGLATVQLNYPWIGVDEAAA